MGDHLRRHRWSGVTIYGSHTWPGGPSTATYFATDGPGGPIWGDHLWHDSPQLQQVAKFLNSVASICAPCALVLFVATPHSYKTCIISPLIHHYILTTPCV